ncbi:MAG: glycosyltransferase family 39 protein [Rhizobiaceae bacterium]
MTASTFAPSGLDAILREPRRAVAAILVLLVVFWTVFASLSRYNLDIHGDMVENFAWGIGWQLGYYKHPPLYSWISAVWLSIFPRTNFFYHMLSMTSVAAATFAMWRISTRFFSPAQQVVLVATVFFLPPLTFLSINYNATSAMAPFWAFTLLFYIRGLERRDSLDAFLVGLVAGLAMIAKYHSAVLLLAIFMHSIVDREARSIYRTRLPWVALLGFIIPVAPHIWWLFDTGFLTVRYAAEQGSGNWTDVLWSAAEFVPAMLLYSAPGFLVLAAHRYPRDGKPLFDVAQIRPWWATVQGRALLAAIALPPVLTTMLGLVLDAQLSSLWSIPFFVFFPFLMVACLPANLAERYRFVVPMLLGGFCVVALLLAPTMKRYTLSIGRSNSAIPIEQIAEAVQARWSALTDKPLRIVAGENNFLANGVSFYSADRPYAVQSAQLAITPWVTPSDIEQDGAALLCETAALRADCKQLAEGLLGRVDAREVFTVTMPGGAPAPDEREYQVYFRLPGT